MGKRKAQKDRIAQGEPNIKSRLRHEHLKDLALCSSAGDTPIPSLASFFGRCLAADGEAAGIATDTDLVTCKRCETILKPGFNCSVRIQKVSSAQKKHKRCNKYNISLPQNNVVYNCNFCSQPNLKRGTAKGQMKELYPSKPKIPKMKKEKMMPQETQSNMISTSSPERDQLEISLVNTPKPMLTLERDKRIRKSKIKKPIESASVSEKTVCGSNKRKPTSIKEMAETNKRFKIPFHLCYVLSSIGSYVINYIL